MTGRNGSGEQPRPTRLPFTVTDELNCYFDTPAEPANVHLEITLLGRLDPAAFRTAALAALAANPRTSSRRAPGHRLSRRFFWEQTAQLEHDPVAFTACSDDDELASQRAGFIARAPCLDTSPPVAVLVASSPESDHVILNVHHAAMDGQSCVELLREIARRYRDETGQADGGGPAVPDSPPQPVVAKLATAAQWSSARRLPARVAAERGGHRGCGVLVLTLPDVPAVPPLADGDKATLNDVLIAALMMTVDRWNADHGQRPRQIRITVPVNARPPGQQRAAGNLSRLVTVTADPSALRDESGLLRGVARQVRHARLNPSPPVDGASRAIAALWCPTSVKRWLLRATLRTAGRLACDTAMLTNLGNVASPPDFGAPAAAAMAFSSTAHMPRGLSIGAVTVNGHLAVALRYNRALLDEAAAAEFAIRYQATLDRLTAASSAGRI